MSTWKPHDRQEIFLSIPDSVFEAFYGGAAFGGKSEVLMNLPLCRDFYNHPRFKGIIFRRTYPELEKSLIPRSYEYYKPTGGDYNSQLHRWKWPSGAYLDFGYAEHEQDVRTYDTTEYNYMGFDELTSFTEFQYLYLTSRCRSSSTELPALVRSASNPGNVGHGWVRKRFVEPCKTGFKILLDQLTKTKRIFIPAKATDNPYGMANDPQYIERLKLLPIAERRAKLDGDWWTFEGQVFDDWRSERLPDEPENALHVIDPFPIPFWWPVILAVDWGYAAMTYAGWLAISPEKRAYLFQEFYCTKTKISSWATDVGRLTKPYLHQLQTCELDPSAWAKRGDEKTISEQFEEHSGLTPNRADNDRIGGKILMQEYIRWRPKPLRNLDESQFSRVQAEFILRNYGLPAYKDYLASFKEPPPETNLPKLQVFRNCTKFIETIPLCVHPPADADGKPIEDVAEFVGDDPYDAGRYGIKACERYILDAEREMKRQTYFDSAVKHLEETQDQTSFYRRMEYLERNQPIFGDAPVRGRVRRGYVIH